MSRFEVILLLSALVLMGAIVEVVRRRRLAESFALLWLGVGLAAIVLAIARPVVDRLSEAVGIEYGANLFFGVAVIFLAFVCISLSVHISRLESRVEALAEEVAFLRGARRSSADDPPEPVEPDSTHE